MLRNPSSSPLAESAVLVATHLRVERAGAAVLADVSLKVAPTSRVGVIGPNGVGKSTLLAVLAGQLEFVSGSRTLDPPRASIGYLAQEHEQRSESVHEFLARRTGIADADFHLREAAALLASNTAAAIERYDVALARFEALGAGTFDARASSALGELGVPGVLDAPMSSLSGGQEAKVALAAIELSRYDIVLLDEPTNDLDFEGLARLEEWIARRVGGLVVVSHDRSFLERTVSSVLEIDEHSRTAREYGGGWLGYVRERAHALRRAREAYEDYAATKQELSARAQRQRQWAVVGVKNEKKNPRDHDVAQRDFRINRTEKLAAKARQSERALERLEEVDKPFEGWDLHFSIDETKRSGDVVVRLDDVVVERGSFRLGPITQEIVFGERIALTGVNGSGKSTLISILLGDLTVHTGTRTMGPGVVVGTLGQDRRALSVERDTVRFVSDRCQLDLAATRSLLAKFALGASDVTRPPSTLSPGQRTRVELAIFQSLGVNLLVLDEPTNHLDLPAIEQLEVALSHFTGTLVLTSHDRRLLESMDFSRTWQMSEGRLREDLASVRPGRIR
ncbi:MAG TPA: ABC-F family ATP-binding cassette domain-containing protein [Acidimicrobiales bacterium]